MYYNGDGVEKDYDKYIEILTKASDAGNFHAMNLLANTYLEGKICEQDVDKALKLWEKGAQGDDIDSIWQLVTLYYNGKYVEKDLDKAVEYLKQSADLGDIPSVYALISIYMKQKDVTKTREICDKYAEMDDGMCYFTIGLLYLTNVDYRFDSNQTMNYMKKSADKGFSAAMISLAEFYKEGLDGKKDNDMYKYWFDKALENEKNKTAKQKAQDSEIVDRLDLIGF